MEAPASILEAPGLDLGGFGNDFFKIFDEKLELISNSSFKLCDGSFDFKFSISSKAKKEKISQDRAKPQDACLESSVRWPRSVGPRSSKMGGRRWSPPGGFQSAAHRRWSRVLDHRPNLGRVLGYPSPYRSPGGGG